MAAFRAHRRTRLLLTGLTVVALTVWTASLIGWPSHSSHPAKPLAARPSTSLAKRALPKLVQRPSSPLAKRSVAATQAAVGCGTAVHLAFGGDVNTANDAARVLSNGLGSAGTILRGADVAMVNTETVFADNRAGLVRVPKAYNFVAPTRLLDVLEQAGVDVVTVANNHGLDYGQLGLTRTMAARSAARPQMIGAGANASDAFAPARSVVRGRGVAIFAATDVMDDGLDWTATDTRPGLASVKTAAGLAQLRTAVRADRQAHPCEIIAVYLHAGVELNVCPTARQQLLATDLAADGASVVLMSHAHVVQPGRVIGDTAVDFGLGNFVFAGHSGLTSQTGVLTVDVPAAGAPTETWHPGRIVDGLPTMLTGTDATAATQHWQDLIRSC